MVVSGNNKIMPNRPGNPNNAKRFRSGNLNRRMNMGNNLGNNSMNAMFNTNQIPSNGYLDFTEPTNNMSNNTNSNNQKQFKNNVGSANTINKSRNRGNNNNGHRQQGGNNNNTNGNIRWGNNNRGRQMSMNNSRNNNMNNNMRQSNMMHGGQFEALLPRRMHPMMPPPMGMLPPLPLPIHNGRFGLPRPLMPPIVGPMGPIRRPPNFRMEPGPFPIRGGIMPRSGTSGPVRRNNKVAGGMVNKNNRRNGNAPTNQKNRKKNQLKNGKRTYQNVNKYALEKPWVNDEIREAHQIKTDLENQLKGKKNDEVFAKFKEQRDKFVSLYDAAKQAFITTQKEDKEKVLKESDTGEQNDTKKDVEMPNASAAS